MVPPSSPAATTEPQQKNKNVGTITQLWHAYWRRKWLVTLTAAIAILSALVVYGLAADPYSSDSFVETPFTTTFENGQVVLHQHFTPHVYSGWLANAIGYAEQALLVVWDRIRSPKEPAGTVQSITAAIYAQRFDPSKPYLISGDQFGELYPRNLTIFYQGMLDPHTALNSTDWHNRERIAVQSLAYALSVTQQLKYPVTTFVPITPRGVIATDFWDYPSDTMYSLFQLLQNLEANPDTRAAAQQLQRQYGGGLETAYRQYLHTVRDPKTGLIRSDIFLSSARDAAQRQSSFYDNVILWRTEQLATQLGFDTVTSDELTSLRQTIMGRYWNRSAGHFIDDVAPGNQQSYSSDWLIALPTGFLNSNDPADTAKLTEISAYIDKYHLTDPLPIRYTADPDPSHQHFFVRYFVGSYGNTAIWSYWGNEYITLETDLYKQTGNPLYAQHVEQAIAAWDRVIVRDCGYPETLDGQGKLLLEPLYESIRRNGWIVTYQEVRYNWELVAPKGL